MITVVACLVWFSSPVLGDGLFLNFDEPDILDDALAPNPYFGTTWTDSVGSGTDLGLLDYAWYNPSYGASLSPISGEQAGWSNAGIDNIGVDFGGDYIAKSIYLTPWFGFGPSSMQLDLYDDGGLVGSVTNISMVENQWTFVDLGGVKADSMVFRNFGDSQWYLMEDLTLSKIPEPSSTALLGLCLIGGLMRRRRS